MRKKKMELEHALEQSARAQNEIKKLKNIEINAVKLANEEMKEESKLKQIALDKLILHEKNRAIEHQKEIARITNELNYKHVKSKDAKNVLLTQLKKDLQQSNQSKLDLEHKLSKELSKQRDTNKTILLEKNSMNEKYNATEKDRVMIKNKLDDISIENNGLTEKLNQMKNEKKKTQDLLKEKKKEEKNIMKQLKQHETKEKKLENELKQLQDQMGEHSSLHAMLQGSVDVSSLQVQELLEKQSMYQNERQKLETAAKNASNEKKKILQDKQKIKQENKKLKDDLKNAQQNMHQQVKDLQQQHAAKVKELQDQQRVAEQAAEQAAQRAAEQAAEETKETKTKVQTEQHRADAEQRRK